MILESLAGIKISARHINRMADKVGRELREQQQLRVELHAQGKLKVEVSNIPELAVIETDGGRIRTRETECGSGTHNPAWKETKTALCMRMSSEVHEHDPAPEPPNSLQNRHYVGKLAKEVAGVATMETASVEDDDSTPIADSSEEASAAAPEKYESPKRLMRTCLASLDDSKTFGRMVAAEAHRKGFFQAARHAFVGDGMKCNWTMWKTHFATFIPIVDFIHVISYLYKAAVAIGESEDFGWGLCADWIRACWQGRVDDVTSDLRDWLNAQLPAPPGVADDDPREIYLTNNRSRMDYPSYRRAGLPMTSTLMESLIKEVSYRVKGTEKFWNDPDGANHILAAKAAALSDDNRLLPAI